jgi:hypothetical protein
MQVDGRGEHGHLHALFAAKHPAPTIEDRAHRSTMPPMLLALADEVIE